MVSHRFSVLLFLLLFVALYMLLTHGTVHLWQKPKVFSTTTIKEETHQSTNILDKRNNNELETSVTIPKLGKLIGAALLYSSKGRKYYAFRGIPYAKPPIGELRFKVRNLILIALKFLNLNIINLMLKEPEPVEPWEILNATDYGFYCIQLSQAALDYMSEDCLTLNIFTHDVNTL